MPCADAGTATIRRAPTARRTSAFREMPEMSDVDRAIRAFRFDFSREYAAVLHTARGCLQNGCGRPGDQLNRSLKRSLALPVSSRRSGKLVLRSASLRTDCPAL